MSATSRLRVVMALCLVTGLLGLAPLAFARPPDPEWVHGVYDDADYDDVVLSVTSMSGSLDSRAPLARVVSFVQRFLPSAELAVCAVAPSRTFQARAPPSA